MEKYKNTKNIIGGEYYQSCYIHYKSVMLECIYRIYRMTKYDTLSLV